MQYATLNFNGTSLQRKIGWPVDCYDPSVIRTLVYDACELPYNTQIRITDSQNSIIYFENILSGDVSNIYVRLQDAIKVRPQAEQMLSLMTPPEAPNYHGNDITSGAAAGGSKRSRRYITYGSLFPTSADDTTHGENAPLIKRVDSTDDEADPNEMNIFNQSMGRDSDFRGRAFQAQITKFQRILAHLVNERTILAWFRTNLAFVTLSLKYMTLAQKYDDPSSSSDGTGNRYSHAAAIVLYLCGGLFVLFLPLSWHFGWNRFKKCREILDYDITKISTYLYKMGFDLDNAALGSLIVISFFGIAISSTIIIWYSSSSSSST
jgi:uncharacterized membrane protein YidH (DUF202 family)